MNLNKLVSKLDPKTKGTLALAAAAADTRGHPAVEIEHWLLMLLQTKDDTDLALVLRHFGIDPGRVEAELNRAISHFRSNTKETPTLSSQIPKLISECWSLASIEHEATLIRSGHIIQVLLSRGEHWSRLYESSPTLMSLDAEKVAVAIPQVFKISKEEEREEAELPSDKIGRYPNLERFGSDLTDLARQGKIDPVIGRDSEIHQVCEILLRRRQNNPIIAGEAGVGKTAIAEGFALTVAENRAPGPLKGVEVWSLDLGSIKAGAGVRGEYEQRLKSVLKEVKDSAPPIILFVDEAHLLMGGGSGETADAANLIKPELARGELRMIAATTWSDYKRHMEKDPALARRFQVIKIREPSPEQALAILEGTKEQMMKHHEVEIEHKALQAAVELSNRYIVGRKLPDKAIGVLDTACARVRLGKDGKLPEETEKEQEKSNNETATETATETPPAPITVVEDDVANVVSDWTGIPIGGLLSDRISVALSLEQTLNEHVIGQKEALAYVVKQIKTYLANLADLRKPMGTMLLVGPSGVGKTETAITLAETFFGSERNMITFNMSEYQESHTVSNLKGAPPGYVGYGQGGLLTEAVRRNPYSLVLFDELEKAHPDVIEMFYQILDKGWMEDSEGNEVSFSNCIILMTSNAGSEIIYDNCQKATERPSPEVLVQALSPTLQRVFKPAFLGRVQIVPYYPLDEEGLTLVTDLKLGRLKKRFKEAHHHNLILDPEVVQDIVRQCRATPVGARYIDNLIGTTIQPRIANLVLTQMANNQPINDLRVSLTEDNEISCVFPSGE